MKRYSFVIAFFFLGIVCQSAVAIVTGQYPLDNTAVDTSGFGRDGTLVAAPTFTTLSLYHGSSAALKFNGTSQSVSLPGSTDFIRNAPGATLMAWVRPTSTAATSTFLAVSNGDTAANAGFGSARAALAIAGGQFRALGRQGDLGAASFTATGTSAPSVNTSYFVAGVFDFLGGSIRLYVNGQEVASNLTTGWAANSTDTSNLAAKIGALPSSATGTEFFTGAVDGARLFNTALTASAISTTYQSEAFMLGDTDDDGVFELSDLDPIRSHYRQNVTLRSDGDLTGDGVVNFADFRQWKTRHLTGGGTLAGLDLSFAAPEPSTFWLAAAGFLSVFGKRKRALA